MAKIYVKEKGFFLVFVALTALVLVSLCALVVGLGFLSTGRQFLQNSTNLSALSALEAFVANSEQPTSERLELALERANLILQTNEVMGVKEVLKELGFPNEPGPGGVLSLGTWYTQEPAAGPVLGCEAYPCFNPAPDAYYLSPSDYPDIVVNAVRIIANNEPGNFLVAPFLKVFGSLGFNISAQATAAVAQRCGAFLIDVNRSSAFNTHRDYYQNQRNNSGVGPYRLALPLTRPVATFAFPAEQIAGLDCRQPLLFSHQVQWCNMGRFYDSSDPNGASEQVWTTQRDSYVDDLPFRHFQSDYKLIPWGSDNGTIWVDSFVHEDYQGPQPLTTFFLSFNAALRLIQAQGSFGDLFQIKGFTGIPAGRSVYPDPEDGPPLTTNLDMGIQLTNMNNRGLYDINDNLLHPKFEPNFVTMGWVPLNTSGLDNFKDITRVLETTISDLSTQCPETSRKFIIIASDFRVNCAPWDPSNIGDDCTNAPYHSLSEELGLAWGYQRFSQARQRLIGEVLPLLQERGISLTVIFDGQHVRPHFVNLLKPDCPTPENPTPECFVKLDEARSYGHYGENNQLFESVSFDANGQVIQEGRYDMFTSQGGLQYEMDHQFAFSFAGLLEEVQFGEALPLAARLAIDSGGYICPLLPPANRTQYKNSAGEMPPADGSADEGPYYLVERVAGQAQFSAVEYLTKAEQAAICGQKTVGMHPYMLVEEP